MAKVAVPIIRLKYASADAYDNRVMDIFEDEGAWDPHETFTYTGRVSLDLGNEADIGIRHRIVRRIKSEMVPQYLSAGEADALIALLNEHDWDVSFFVDTY